MKICCCALVFLLLVVLCDEVTGVTFHFKRYTYKKKRDDKKYRNAKSVCELKSDCLNRYGVQQTTCIRKCVSEHCYNELYGHDELEEGEIDVRFNSYKGCLSQEKRLDYN